MLTHDINKILWPVPQSYSNLLPRLGEPGCFWEDRGDRFHCGVDIYAPFDSPVIAIADGLVLQVQLFTSPEMIRYWNLTYAVIIHHKSGLVVRYAEMGETLVHAGDRITGGDPIGRVGMVLEPSRITEQAPLYIQKLKKKNNPTMLHIEMFDRYPFEIPDYLGGNTFQKLRPDCLVDPSLVLPSD